MILGNQAIQEAIAEGWIRIVPSPPEEAYNTSSVDLHLASEIRIPRENPCCVIDLSGGSVADYLDNNCDEVTLSASQPYKLTPGTFILARTAETVGFPIADQQGQTTYAARVEGRSSVARCGVLVHFTAPTIHAGFEGTITLEMINLGRASFNLVPGQAICQLIIEEVRGSVTSAPSQFQGQTDSTGARKSSAKRNR